MVLKIEISYSIAIFQDSLYDFFFSFYWTLNIRVKEILTFHRLILTLKVTKTTKNKKIVQQCLG